MRSISGLVVEYIVAIDVTLVHSRLMHLFVMVHIYVCCMFHHYPKCIIRWKIVVGGILCGSSGAHPALVFVLAGGSWHADG